jgi:glycosyltransferase involved in cell wall biosynthesis
MIINSARGNLAPLSLVSGTAPTASSSGVRAYIAVHNEMERLPFVIDYHLNLGVTEFFIVDDRSTDGTSEYLHHRSLSDPLFIYSPSNSYKESRGALDWVETLMDHYSDNSWSLKLDADELVTFEDSETRTLGWLVENLNNSGSEGMMFYMLDLYPSGPISTVKYNRGEPFWNAARWFDPSINMYPRLRLRSSPDVMVTGGARTRAFYPELMSASGITLAQRRIMRELTKRVSPLRGFYPTGISIPPILEKVPLRKWISGKSTFHSAHQTDRIKLSRSFGALLHFKYLGDFHLKVKDAVSRGQYFDGASEYKRYLSLLDRNENWSLWSENSVPYEGSQQLIALKLISRL